MLKKIRSLIHRIIENSRMVRRVMAVCRGEVK